MQAMSRSRPDACGMETFLPPSPLRAEDDVQVALVAGTSSRKKAKAAAAQAAAVGPEPIETAPAQAQVSGPVLT